MREDVRLLSLAMTLLRPRWQPDPGHLGVRKQIEIPCSLSVEYIEVMVQNCGISNTEIT